MKSVFGGGVVTEERRDVIRMSCRIKLECHIGPKVVEAVASNLSLKGARLETREPLKKGSEIVLSQPDSSAGPVTCKVMWVRRVGDNHSAGLLYADTDERMARSWLKEVLMQMGFRSGKIKERRVHLRMNATARATLCNRQGDTFTEGKLNNLSTGGAQVTVEVEVPVNTNIRLVVDPTVKTSGLDIAGVVRSSRKDSKSTYWVHGIKFDFTGEAQVLKVMKALQKARSGS